MKFVLLLSLLVSSSDGQGVCSSSVCIPSTYNKMDMPMLNSDDKDPFKVEVSMMLLDIYKINYDDFTMDLNVYMRFSWIDNRLILNETTSADVNVDFIQNLWIPDFYIYDLKQLQTRQIITPEKGLNIKKELDKTKVTFIFEPEVIIVCPVDYSEFPFHSHTCNLRIGSFSQYSDKMQFVADPSWSPGQALDKDKIRDYDVNVSYLTGDQTIDKAWTKNDKFYSIAGLKIELQSRYAKYIYIYYIPTTMFTLTSWVSFLLPPTCYPARTTLLVTVFLCQIGIFNAVIKDTPNKDGGEAKTVNNSLEPPIQV